MNEILASNLHLLAMSTLWFTQTFGINTDEFINAINGSTLAVVTKFYEDKGVNFDIETVRIEEDAMMAVYEHIMGIAKMAALARAVGITPNDLKGE
jgi:xylose isomerase